MRRKTKTIGKKKKKRAFFNGTKQKKVRNFDINALVQAQTVAIHKDSKINEKVVEDFAVFVETLTNGD